MTKFLRTVCKGYPHGSTLMNDLPENILFFYPIVDNFMMGKAKIQFFIRFFLMFGYTTRFGYAEILYFRRNLNYWQKLNIQSEERTFYPS